MLKKASLIILSFVSLTGAVSAADLSKRTPAPSYLKPASTFSWTGFYLGAHAGYSFSNNGNTTTVGTPAFVGLGSTLTPSSLNTKSNGFIGGAQAGYNFQAGNLVYGIEADISYIDRKKTASSRSTALVLGSNLTTTASSKLDYLGTLRGRVGFTPVERMLVFATGGLAFGGVNTTGRVVADAAPTLEWNGSKSNAKVGFALGAGAEYALTDNISLKAEYLYYNLGKQTTSANGNVNVRSTAALNGIDYVSRTKTEGSIVRAGANYKF
jgi:outer membrane immunogenic protein